MNLRKTRPALAADQWDRLLEACLAEAAERRFERRAQVAAIAVLVAFGLLGAYSYLALAGAVPAAPWSPVGKAGAL